MNNTTTLRYMRHTFLLLCMFFQLGFSGAFAIAPTDSVQCRLELEAGNRCRMENRYSEALSHYVSAMEGAQQYGRPDIYCRSTNNVGTLYAVYNNYERAIFYFRKAYDMAVEADNSYLIWITSTNLISSYCSVGQPEKAETFLPAMQEYPHPDSIMHEFYLLSDKGLIAAAWGRHEEAIAQFEQGLMLVEQHQMSADQVVTLAQETGKSFRALQLTDSALYYFRLAIAASAVNKDYEGMSDTYKEITDIYQQQQLSDSIIKYQSLLIGLSDSIFNLQQFHLAQDELHSYEQQEVSTRIDTLNAHILLLITGLSIIGIVLALILYNTRQLRAAQKVLVRRNQELIEQVEESRLLRERQQATNNHTSSFTDLPSKEELEEGDSDRTITISSERQYELLQQIATVMNDISIIANPDFDLNSLAKMLQSNSKYVSLAINNSSGRTFTSYLNECRIREASKRINDPAYSHLTLAAIANSVGYNSINSFNTNFKRIVGMTPSKYRQLSQEEQ